jgi:hypothetical protein
LEEPRVDEQECAIDFPTCIVASPDMTKSQCCQVLGQAMDLISMVWIVEVCLLAQEHNKGGLMDIQGQLLHAKGQRMLYFLLWKTLLFQRPRYSMIVDKHGAKFLKR